ncbi:PH domain-containing protein [Colletotrichum higginsianum]|nr:PH domain-containing protein [Colletotrichum higginsianum]
MRSRGVNAQVMGPPPPSHQSRDPRVQGRGIPLPGIDTNSAFQRKPLPARSDSLRSPQDTPLSASSGGSWGNNIIDQAGFQQVQPRDPRQRTPLPEQQVHRVQTQRSDASYYDDASSTASPDYASRKSSETQRSQKSFERPRAGVLKTVGGAESPHSDMNIPDINFGPTVNYAASQPARNKTPTPLNYQSGVPGLQRPFSPAEAIPPRTTKDTADRILRIRKVAWQPGAAAVSTGQGISPEQFVQQRAAQATTSMYAHGRTPSGNILTMRSMTPTPSMNRRGSSEMLARHSRSISVDLLQRPSSRGANTILDTASSGEVSSHLSAREQEHVARMTGSPLITPSGYGAGPAPNFGYGQGSSYGPTSNYGQAGGYSQGGGYANPMAMRQGRQSPGPQMMDPRFMPQGPYSPGSQQGGRGQNYPAQYQGQGQGQGQGQAF